MKTIIRNSCFETNSSSCHTVSVSSNAGVLDTIYPCRDTDYISFSNRYFESEFGWDAGVEHNDPESKFAYLYVYARDWASNKSEEYINFLLDVVKKHTGVENINTDFFNEPSSYGGYANGYIDHQSVENRELDYIFEDKSGETIKNFIFNPQSYIMTDNDNY